MEVLAPVVLLVTLKIESDKILLKYSVENKSGAEIFLVNHLTRYEPGKGWIPDAKVIYVALDDQQTIELSKRVPPVPDNRLVTPRDYYVTPLPDGERLEEEIALSIPLRENRPYDALIEPIPEPREIETALSFSMGYFESLPNIEAKKVVVHDVPTYDLVPRNPPSVPGAGLSDSENQQAEGATTLKEIILKSEPIKVKLQVISLPKKVRS